MISNTKLAMAVAAIGLLCALSGVAVAGDSNHQYDWLSPGGIASVQYYGWHPGTHYTTWYPHTYYKTSYYFTPTYYYYPMYNYKYMPYRTFDPWWDANVYGYGTTTYYWGWGW